MKWMIVIDDANAAFDDTPVAEFARILMKLATRANEEGSIAGPILDLNGNTCGDVAEIGELRGYEE